MTREQSDDHDEQSSTKTCSFLEYVESWKERPSMQFRVSCYESFLVSNQNRCLESRFPTTNLISAHFRVIFCVSTRGGGGYLK